MPPPAAASTAAAESAEEDPVAAVQLPTVKLSKGRPKQAPRRAASTASASSTTAQVQSPQPAAAEAPACDWSGLWDFVQKEVLDKPVQSLGRGEASQEVQAQGPPDLEILAEMVDLANSGYSVVWPPGLTKAAAVALLAGSGASACSQASPAASSQEGPAAGSSGAEQQPHEWGGLRTWATWSEVPGLRGSPAGRTSEGAKPECEPPESPVVVFSSQELEAELAVQLDLEGWTQASSPSGGSQGTEG